MHKNRELQALHRNRTSSTTFLHSCILDCFKKDTRIQVFKTFKMSICLERGLDSRKWGGLGRMEACRKIERAESPPCTVQKGPSNSFQSALSNTYAPCHTHDTGWNGRPHIINNEDRRPLWGIMNTQETNWTRFSTSRESTTFRDREQKNEKRGVL